jgi:deoxyribonuclease IV
MYGLHVKRGSDQIDVVNEIRHYLKYNISCIQFFIKSPKRSVGKLSSEKKKELGAIQKYCHEHNITTFIHAPYSINLGNILTNPNSDKLDWWIHSIIKEVRIANEYGVSAVIVHVGKYMTSDQKESLKSMYNAINIIFEHIQTYKTDLLLETPAGQGTELLSKFDDFLNFYASLSSNVKRKIFICLDTCHMFSSGVDLRGKELINGVMEKIDKKIGLDAIHLIHFNDSKNEYNAHRDVHENIGVGSIGLDAMKFIWKWAKKYNIPMILETPHTNIINDLELFIKWNKQ